jgi:hypothetical protein
MEPTANGHFEIKMAPEAMSATAADNGIGRMSLAKQYFGDIEGHATGEMLGFRNVELGAGGYVAMETVCGTLAGKRGSFVLQHSSTMAGGAATQSIQVVPGSGTEELTGLSGQLSITQTGGQHQYTFSYSLR